MCAQAGPDIHVKLKKNYLFIFRKGRQTTPFLFEKELHRRHVAPIIVRARNLTPIHFNQVAT
jgi:hypothetical protein